MWIFLLEMDTTGVDRQRPWPADQNQPVNQILLRKASPLHFEKQSTLMYR